ncbi:hypothetical protein TNCV_1957221 [Trichonephila clavipes]|nr:hypothetical protein TNCV_1957221 [Trichonephila clavipes]
MITNFFIPELNNHDVQELWFQQDGTTCHTARATIDLLKDTLGDHLISRFEPVNWPPRSYDLTTQRQKILSRLKRAEHLDRMNEDCSSKKMLLEKPMGNIPRGRPPLRWIDCVENDLNILKIKNWKTVAKNRDAWRKLLEKPRGHPGLSSH